MSLTEIFSLVSTLAMVVVFWRMGGNTANSNLQATNAAVMAAQDKQIQQLREEVKELTSKLGELYGMLKEKTKQIEDYKALMVIKNPEMEAYMKSSSIDLHEIKDLLTVTQMERRKDRKTILKNIKD